MALKGTEIKSMLPDGGKKNCKECGLPTCFAFAMKVAKVDIGIDKCPYLDPAVKAEIEEALKPAMVLVTIGQGEEAVEIGQEEVLYRHEKSFLRQPGIAILVSDTENDEAIDQKLQQVKNAVFERAQLILKPDLWALKFDSGDRSRFESIVQKVYDSSPLTAVIISEDLAALFGGRDIYKDRNPLIYPITQANINEALPKIKESPTPVGLKAEKIEDFIPLTGKLKAEGIQQLVLDLSSKTLMEGIQNQTIIRRAALKQANRALGYPTIAFPYALTEDPIEEILYAGAFVAKYAGIVVLSTAAGKYLFPLLVQRMDIYTDPRKLRTVEGKVYLINEPGEDSPVLVTTNFALTYFVIASATELSRVPAYLAIVDTGGFGVDTALADGRFQSKAIADFFKEHGLNEKVKTKRLILPAVAARVKNELMDNLPDWEAFIGPKDANQLSGFLVEKAKEWGIKLHG